jgi:murein DD-endopeptidase MepM/ murein hydrolase activator NlpD
MRRLLVGAAVLALCAIGGPAVGTAASPSPSPSPSPSAKPPAVGAVALPSSDIIDAQLALALAQQAQLAATKRALSQEIASANTEKSQLTGLIIANQKQITATMQMIDTEQRNLADATQKAVAAHARADDALQRAAADRIELAAIIRHDYEQPDGYIGYILAGNDLSAMMDRAAQVRQITSSTTDLVANLRDAEARAKAQEILAQAAEERARQAAATLQTQRDTLTRETTNEQSLVDQLGSQASAATRELHAIDGQDAAVAQRVAALRIEQLDKIIADAEQAAWDQAQYYTQNSLTGLPESAIPYAPPIPGATGAGAILGAPGAPRQLVISLAAGKPLMWPAIHVELSQGFGPTSYSFEPPSFGFAHFHAGLDMAAPTGTPIHSAAAGIVASASPGSTGYGNHIVVASDKHVMCLYGHLQVMLVKPGDAVVQGQVIGLMGSTGNSSGSHLHFEVRVDGIPVDPAPLLGPPPPVK